MELYVYSRDMTLQGIVEKISSLIWTRRYWSCGEFKLLVPFTEEHARLLVKENIIIKRGGNEAAEIRYIHITKNSQGMEEIEVQGKFLLSWIGKRILTTQIITYIAFVRNRDKDKESNVKHDATVLTEIGYIKANTDEIKAEQKEQRKTNTEFVTRLTDVEASAKQAHKRLDHIEKRMDQAE